MSFLDTLSKLVSRKEPLIDNPTGYEVESVGGFDFPVDKKSDYLAEMKGWVSACVGAISDGIAAINLKLYKLNKNDTVEEVVQHEILDSLYKVNEYTTKYDHFKLTQQYLELTGESPWFIDKDGTTVKGIYFLRPDRFQPIPDDKSVIAGYWYIPKSGKKIRLERDQVIFLKTPNPSNPLRGMGTLEQAARTVDIDNFAEEWNKNFFLNSARPDSVLTVKDVKQMTKKQREELVKSAENQYQGTKKSHKLMVLLGEMSIDKFSPTQKDMDFSEQMRSTRDKIFGIFRVPKAIVAQTDDVNFANAKTARVIFAENTVKPKMESLVQQLNEFYVPMFKGTEAMYLDYTSPVPDDEEFQLKKKETGLKNSYYTINEVRSMEGLPEVEGGDVIYVPLSLMPLGSEPEVKKLALRVKDTKKIVYANPERVRQIKARSKSYFTFQQIKDRIKEQVKDVLKKELEVTNIPNQNGRMEWTEEQKSSFWNRKNQLYQTFVPKVRKSVKSMFKEEEKIVLEQLKAGFKAFEKVEKLSPADVVLSKKVTEKLAVKLVLPLLTDLFEQSGNETLRSLGLEETIDVTKDRIEKLLKARTRKFSNAVTETLNEFIRDQVVEGLALGEGVNDLSKRIVNVFSEADKYRADLVARTETARYNSMGTEEAFVESEIVEGKAWQVDGNPCERCIEMQAKFNNVALGDTFVKKGDNDPKGVLNDYDDIYGPPLHPNCECEIVPVFKTAKQIALVKIKKRTESIQKAIVQHYHEDILKK